MKDFEFRVQRNDCEIRVLISEEIVQEHTRKFWYGVHTEYVYNNVFALLPPLPVRLRRWVARQIADRLMR